MTRLMKSMVKCMHPYRKRKFFFELDAILGTKSLKQIVPSVNHTSSSKCKSIQSELECSQRKVNEEEDDEEIPCTNEDGLSQEPSVPITSQCSCTEIESYPRSDLLLNDVSARSDTKKLAVVPWCSESQSIDSFNESYDVLELQHQDPKMESQADSMPYDSICMFPLQRKDEMKTEKEKELNPQERSKKNDVIFKSTKYDMIRTKIQSEVSLSNKMVTLEDYYDWDRLTGRVPCWKINKEFHQSMPSSCLVHEGVDIPRPMLLFCMQVLDEYIEQEDYQEVESYVSTMLRHARRVLFSIHGSLKEDLDFQAFVTGRQSMEGICPAVWDLIGKEWMRLRPFVQHHSMLTFNLTLSEVPSKQDRFPKADHQPSSQHPRHGSNYQRKSTRHLRSVNPKVQEFEQNYLMGCEHQDEKKLLSEASSEEWKLGFKALEIHLQTLFPGVKVFPCGSFARGALLGSVMDILVSYGDMEHPYISIRDFADALVRVNVIQTYTTISESRCLSLLALKRWYFILDLKVYSKPQSWFALTYFSGPERFVCNLWKDLWSKDHGGMDDTSFANIFRSLVAKYGVESIQKVLCEEDVFRLFEKKYISPTRRW